MKVPNKKAIEDIFIKTFLEEIISGRGEENKTFSPKKTIDAIISDVIKYCKGEIEKHQIPDSKIEMVVDWTRNNKELFLRMDFDNITIREYIAIRNFYQPYFPHRLTKIDSLLED